MPMLFLCIIFAIIGISLLLYFLWHGFKCLMAGSFLVIVLSFGFIFSLVGGGYDFFKKDDR